MATIAEGLADQLRAGGEIEGKAESVLLILETRSVHVSDEIRARVMACSDAEVLDHWLRRVVVSCDAQALFDG